MRDKRTIFLLISCAAYPLLMLLVPYLRLPKVAASMIAIVAVVMFVQLNISRWFSSLVIRPIYAAAVLVVALGAWFSLVAVVTSPHAAYYVKDYGPVPVRVRQHRPPTTTKIPMMKPVHDSTGKLVGVERYQTTGTLRRSPGLFYKLMVFERFAGRTRVATNLLMILAATAFGYLLSFILRHPNIVLPAGALAAYVDIWTVMVGPTAKAIEKVPHVVNAVSVAMPAAGSASGSFQPVSYIGPADFIFIAMFFGAVYRLKMEPARTFWLIFPLLTLGMASVIGGYFSFGLPALPLIGLAVIAANFRHFKLERSEWIAMGITAVLLVAATVVFMPYVLRR